MEAETTFIYALVDPRTQLIRYIGKANDPIVRFGHHLKERYKSRKCSWVASLAGQGLEPQLVVIERVSVEQWQERERHWIAFYRAQDVALLNDTDGGDGVHGMRHTAEARERIGAAARGNQYGRGYHPTPEQRERKRAALRGQVFTPERRHHISEAKRGHAPSAETRAKISATLKGRSPSDAQREARKGRRLSDEHRQRIRASIIAWRAQSRTANRPPGCTQPELPFTS